MKGAPEPSGPDLMSLTRKVPSSVPSLTHGSLPWIPSSARKKSLPPPAEMRNDGKECPGPGLMSSTSRVPSSVPSLVHSSMPMTPLVAGKKKSPPATAELKSASMRMNEEPAPGLMSFSSRVPPGVPSLTHGSKPNSSLKASKKNVPPLSDGMLRLEPSGPGRISRSRMAGGPSGCGQWGPSRHSTTEPGGPSAVRGASLEARETTGNNSNADHQGFIATSPSARRHATRRGEAGGPGLACPSPQSPVPPRTPAPSCRRAQERSSEANTSQPRNRSGGRPRPKSVRAAGRFPWLSPLHGVHELPRVRPWMGLAAERARPPERAGAPRARGAPEEAQSRPVRR